MAACGGLWCILATIHELTNQHLFSSANSFLYADSIGTQPMVDYQARQGLTILCMLGCLFYPTMQCCSILASGFAHGDAIAMMQPCPIMPRSMEKCEDFFPPRVGSNRTIPLEVKYSALQEHPITGACSCAQKATKSRGVGIAKCGVLWFRSAETMWESFEKVGKKRKKNPRRTAHRVLCPSVKIDHLPTAMRHHLQKEAII